MIYIYIYIYISMELVRDLNKCIGGDPASLSEV
jgi:hypothetical protein